MFSHSRILLDDIPRFARIALDVEEALGDVASDKIISV